MNILFVATAKGLLVYELDTTPRLSQLFFKGFNVNMVWVDPRNECWWVAVSHKHWGQKLHYSTDKGDTWEEVPLPRLTELKNPDGTPAKMGPVWCMGSGGDHRPDDLWMGTEPGALFHSSDQGASFQLVESLWNHESRQKQGQWFGAGKDDPFIHSIVVNPNDSNHIYIAVSCAGVFESKDYGKTWRPKNKGLVATYLPNPTVEVGHDPHLLLMHQRATNVLWQQNHCGIFYSDNGGTSWNDVSEAQHLPYYGFAITLDETDPAKAWVVPVESDEQRVAPDLKLQVYHTSDYGKNWNAYGAGLPAGPSFDIVLRHSFAHRNGHMIMGTTNGNLYHLHTEEEKWGLITSSLTKVNSILIH